MDPSDWATLGRPLSLLIPAQRMTGKSSEQVPVDQCQISVVGQHGEVDWIGVPRTTNADLATAPQDLVVGLHDDTNVIWCRKITTSISLERLQWVRIPLTEVIKVEVLVVIPQRVDGREFRVLRKHVPVEGPAEMLAWRVEVTEDELRGRERLTVGDLRLPVYCETFGLPLREEIATVSKREPETGGGSLVGSN